MTDTPVGAPSTRKSTPLADAASPALTRTGQALVQAAKRLIANGRMDSATLDDIASEAAVSKRTFHNQFRDRDALLEHVHNEVRGELEALIAAVNQGINDPATRFARGLLASYRYGLDDPVGAGVMRHIAADEADPHHPRNEALALVLQQGMANGAIKLAHVDTGIVLILGMSEVGLSRLLPLHDQRPRARLLMRSLCVTLLRALGVDGRRIDRVVDDALLHVIDAHDIEPSREESAA